MAPDTCIILDTNDSADLTSARHGQFQEKGKNADNWIEFIRFEKKLSTEINNKLALETI